MFGLVDLFVVLFVEPRASRSVFLFLRLLGFVALLPPAIRLQARPAPSMGLLLFFDVFACTLLSSLITASSVEVGGIESPLVLGVVTLLLARGTLLSDHVRRAAWPVCAAVLAYPATLLLLSLFSRPLALQLAEPRALGSLGLHLLFLIGAGALTLSGGHASWQLRRQMFRARSFGRYRLKHRLGQGGMGEVWAAQHQTLRREVAIKLLKARSFSDRKARVRFEREVAATCELQHPNAVKIFDYGVSDEGQFYYVMERLRGQHLGELVQTEGRLSPKRATHLVWQAAKALAEAHFRGIIHRDIKPENLFVSQLVCEPDFLTVFDFGLARIEGMDADNKVSRDGWAIGTPDYIAPEIVQGQPAGPPADVYALGMVLYFLLTGFTAFDKDDLQSLLYARVHEKPMRPSERAPGIFVPPRLETIIMRCLETQPSLRYAHAGNLVMALEDVLWSDSLNERPSRSPINTPTAQDKTEPEPTRELRAKASDTVVDTAHEAPALLAASGDRATPYG